MRGFDPVAQKRDRCRQQGETGSDRHQYDQDPSNAHGDYRGLGRGEERGETDHHCETGEGDGFACMPDHFHRRSLNVAARFPLRPEPGQHEQGVIDPYPQSQHDRKGLEEYGKPEPLTDENSQRQGYDDGEDRQEKRQCRRHQGTEHADQHQ